VENEVLDTITAMYAEMQKGFSEVNGRFNKVDERFDKIDKRFDKVDERIDRLEKTVHKIEHEHGEKLSALFDGYKQNSQKLDILNGKVDKLQIEVSGLALKNAYHDKRIIELAQKIK
jgi:archaellum component FlaC